MNELNSAPSELAATGAPPPADSCDMCVDGVVVNQTYGFAAFPPGTVPVQRCDNCARYRSDEAAAVALARERGSNWGVAGDPESDTEPGDWWVAFPDGRPRGTDRPRRRGGGVMGTLDFYWVEQREDPDDPWVRRESLPVGWSDAVDQLRQAAEAALADDDAGADDEVATERRDVLRTISKGLLAQPRTPSYTGRYLRVVPTGRVLTDSITAELRWWVIHNADGLAAVTITTYAGRTFDGTLAWEDIEPHAVSITVGGRTTVLRPERIESFTLDPRRHPTGRPS